MLHIITVRILNFKKLNIRTVVILIGKAKMLHVITVRILSFKKLNIRTVVT